MHATLRSGPVLCSFVLFCPRSETYSEVLCDMFVFRIHYYAGRTTMAASHCELSVEGVRRCNLCNVWMCVMTFFNHSCVLLCVCHWKSKKNKKKIRLFLKWSKKPKIFGSSSILLINLGFCFLIIEFTGSAPRVLWAIKPQFVRIYLVS